MIVVVQRQGRCVRLVLAEGGCIGVFRSEREGLEFARRLFGEVGVQTEFNFWNARGGGGRPL